MELRRGASLVKPREWVVVRGMGEGGEGEVKVRSEAKHRVEGSVSLVKLHEMKGRDEAC